MDDAFGGSAFSETYKRDRFLEWYKSGRPYATELSLQIPLDDAGRRPSKLTLQRWILEWKEQAKKLDDEFDSGFIESVVAKKVEMLRRHANSGKEIQELSLTYLREHANELTPHAAVRLLQLGVEIERQSVGIPQALEKMSKLDDKALLSEITAILQDSNVTIEAIESLQDDE
jgi:hypothetical protein